MQTELVRSRIAELFPDIETETVTFTTKGDRITDRPIAAIGGSGAFAGELERALSEGEVDIAVHSAKDMPVKLGKGLTVDAVLTRADPRDVLITPAGKVLRDAPVIGTSSPRRQAEIAGLYPNAVTKDIRGNVETRLEKLLRGEYDGIILAAAGLKRLGIFGDERFDMKPLDINEFLPAPCQAIIAVESRRGELSEVLGAVNDESSYLSFKAERLLLELTNAGCSSPIGAYSQFCAGKLHIRATADGNTTAFGTGEASEYRSIVERLVSRLRQL